MLVNKKYNLNNLCVVAISNKPVEFKKEITTLQSYIDAECKYIRDFYAKLKAKKERYFFQYQLLKWGYFI